MPADRSRPPDLDDLLSQAGWLRSLSRSLLASPDAEDLVQDTWLVALRQRRQIHGDVRAWMRTVVRRLATRRGSRAARRPAIESRAAHPEVSAPDGQVRSAVERMELQQWLARALLALDEPFRSAVILRHLEGFDARAIGERQGCSPDVARQRVSRGLVRLRAELDRRHGDRDAWALLLVPLAVPAPAPPALPWITGGVLMSSKLALGSAAAVAVMTLVWWSTRPDGSGRLLEEVTADATVPELHAVAEAEEPASLPPARVATVATETPSPTEQGPETPALATRLEGRVVDPEHRPIPGAEVVLLSPELGQFTVLDLEVAHHPQELERTWTDPEGHFSFDAAPGLPRDLRVSAEGFCSESLRRRQAGRHEIVLSRGFLVHGTVTRARDGAPLVDAPLRVFQLGGRGGSCAGKTDARGAYEVRFPFLRDAVLEVTPADTMGSDWLRITPGPDGTTRLDVALEDGLEVRGRVTDAATGEPVARARIGEGWTFRRSVETDADGRYRFPGFGNLGTLELHVAASGYGKALCRSLPSASEGFVAVDFALQRGRLVRGRVLTPEGSPLADAYVCAVGTARDDGGVDHDWRSTRTDPHGRFEVRDLYPGLRHCLVTSAAGFATDIVDLPVNELETPELDVGDLWLVPSGLVAGTVVDGAGRSLAGVEVELTGGGADRGRLRDGAGIPPEAGWYVTRRTTTTDADGRFALGDLSAGDYTVAALLADRPPSRRIALNLDPGGRNVGLVLVMAKGEPLRGQVVDGEGAGIEGVYVGARLMRSRAREASPSPRSPLHARTGPDGVFAFEDMVPGRYDLTFQPFEAPRDRGPWLDTEVLGAETGQNDLRVELPPGAWIRGRVLDAAGGPRIGDIVMALAQDSTRSPNATVDAEGAFALVVEPGLLWNLEVHGPWPGPSFETVFLTEYAVAPGTRDLELRLPAEDPSSGR